MKKIVSTSLILLLGAGLLLLIGCQSRAFRTALENVTAEWLMRGVFVVLITDMNTSDSREYAKRILESFNLPLVYSRRLYFYL